MVFEKLREMNPSGKNEVVEEGLIGRVGQLQAEDFRRYSMIATSVGDLQVVGQWDQFARSLNVPYYNLVCCGLYGFVFVSLGSSYSYREPAKKEGPGRLVTVPSLTLQQALEWARSDKNREFIAAIDSNNSLIQWWLGHSKLESLMTLFRAMNRHWRQW